MILPTDLPRDVAERTPQPGFDTVLERARIGRRRRRTTIASGLAAAVVVAGIAVAVGSPLRTGQPSPGPARPGPTTSWDGSSGVDPSLPGAVRTLLGASHVDVWGISGSADTTAVLWRACDEGDACRFVLTTHAGEDVFGSVLQAGNPVLVPGADSLLLDDSLLTRLTATGDREGLVETGPGDGTVMAGDVFVQTHTQGTVLLRGTKLIPAPIAPGSGGTHNGYVTPDGRLVAVALPGSGAGIELIATDDGRTWEDPTTTRSTGMLDTAVVSGSGDHVAVAILGDAPDGSIPLVQVLVSHDAGRTWSQTRGLDTEGPDGVRDLSSLVVAPSGTTYLTTGSDGLIRIDVDGHALATPLSPYDTSAFLRDEDVCVVAEAGPIDHLQCTADDGATWTAMPLPGFS